MSGIVLDAYKHVNGMGTYSSSIISPSHKRFGAPYNMIQIMQNNEELVES